MSHRWAEALLSLLVLWTAIGLLGLLVSFLRDDTARLRSGIRALALVWAGYLALLLLVSWHEPVHLLPPGHSRCFDGLCFAVTSVEELQGFRARGAIPERLVRVTLSITNGTDGSQSAPGLVATLLDSRGRRSAPVPGLSGVRLEAALPHGAQTRTAPVFRLPPDATGLRLDLTHTGWSPHRLLLNDPESLLHRPSLLLLPPPTP